MRALSRSVLAIIATLCISCHHSQPPPKVIMEESVIDIPHVVEGIKWQEVGPEVILRSETEGIPIFAYLYLPECEMCDIVEKTTFLDEEIVERINSGYIPIKLDLSNHFEIICAMKLLYAPSIVILSKPGKPDVVIQGLTPPSQLLDVLDVREGREKVEKIVAQGDTSG